MRNVSKSVSALLTAAVLVFSFTGCSDKSSTNNTTKTAGTQAPAEKPKPTEISIYLDNTSTDANRNDTPSLHEMERLTNTKITFLEAPNGQSNEKLGVLVAANEVPDIVSANMAILNKYGLDGTWVQMDDPFEKSMPNAKKKLTKEILNKVRASDNKLYVMPTIRDTGAGSYFVRQDWLKRLGMEIPKTLDDYYAMLKAFTEKDPDGNGKKDTFGLALGANLDWLEQISGPYGLGADDWIDDGSGGVTRTAIHPKMKEALAFGAKLYKEGIMDPEWSTQNGARKEEKITNNMYGFLDDFTSTVTRLELVVKKTVPDAKFITMPVPTAPGVTKGVSAMGGYIAPGTTKSINGPCAAVYKNSKHVTEAIKFVDFMFTEEASRIVTFGVEGIHYTLVNGKPTYKPEYAGNENMAKRYKEGVWDKYAFVGFIDQVDCGGWDQSWAPETVAIMRSTINNVLTKPILFNTPSGDANSSEIRKTRDQIFTKIIMGALTVDDGWNQWLKEFDRLNGNKWIKETNDIYKARK